MHIHKRKWLMGFSLFAFITFIILVSIQPKFASAQPESATTEELTHEKVVLLTEEFMDTILQDINKDYQVTDIASKEHLLQEFEKVATKEVAQPYIDYYFYEKKDGLYIVPTETPEWFHPDGDYDMIQKDNKATITQHNESYLHGDYTIEIEFTQQNDKWFITHVDLV